MNRKEKCVGKLWKDKSMQGLDLEELEHKADEVVRS